MRGNVLEIPTSVTPLIRMPVFWLACHNYPFGLYKLLCRWTHNYDGQFVIYFHPWEFMPLNEYPKWKIPFIIRRNSGCNMVMRLHKFIQFFKQGKADFITYKEYAEQFKKKL